MKIAHIVQITPHRSGLYETTRELAHGLRLLGHAACMVDPIQSRLEPTSDRDVPIAYFKWAAEADVLINHSGLSKNLNKLDKPIIHMLHGRPYNSFILEQTGKIAIYSYWRKVVSDPRFKAFVTFWPSFIPYFENIFPSEKLHYIPPLVDLDFWTPDGPSGYKFHGHSGSPNIVCSDLWRDDKDPYHVINAFMYYAGRTSSEAKLHIYAAPQKGTAWEVLKAMLREQESLGECLGLIQGLDNVYRAADVLITPHRIATRSVREALACGLQVVMAPGRNFSPYQADPEDLDAYASIIHEAFHAATHAKPKSSKFNRAIAEKYFNPADTAKQFESILNEVLNNGVR